MIFNIFDCCLSLEGQYPDNRLYLILFCGIFFYLLLLIIVKNIIYYEHLSENIYWLLLILLFFDLTFYINNNREIIERKIKEHLPIMKKEKIKKKPEISTSINDLTNKDIEQGLIEEEYITQITV